jgi:hypothetical protein
MKAKYEPEKLLERLKAKGIHQLILVKKSMLKN